MTEEEAARARRAREVLSGAGWLFDDFINAEMAKVLKSDPDDMTAREIAYNRARVATEVKLGLEALVSEAEADKRMQEERDRRRGNKEQTDGR